MRKLLREVEVFAEKDGVEHVIPGDEGDVRDRQLSANEPLLLAKNALEDSENATALLLVAFNGGGDLLRVHEAEVGDLPEVGTGECM